MSTTGHSKQGRVLNCGSEGTDLIQCAGRGDVKALAALYDLYSVPLYSLAFYIMKDRTEAGNVLKEVFLSIRRDAATFDRSPAGFYICLALRIRNQSVNRLREMSR